MASQTLARILAAHRNNAGLNLPLPPAVARGRGDLSADGTFSPLDERIIAGAAEALDAGETHYVDVPGIMPLRVAVAAFLNDGGGAHQAGDVIITAGAQESRFLALQKIGELHDNIGIPAVAHPGVRKALGVRPQQTMPLPPSEDPRLLPAVSAIAEAVAGGCRLVYLESPSRLTGAVYSPDEVAEIARVLSEHGASAIWDQGLAPWVEGGCASLAGMDGAQEWVAVIGEAFPGAGLESWCIAYIAAPAAWTPGMTSQKQIMAICTSTAAQYAALAASEIYAEAQGPRLARLSRLRRELAGLADEAGLEALPGKAANILAMRGPGQSLAALRGAEFDAADGADFGAPGILRLNVNEAAADALSALGQAGFEDGR